MSKNISRKKICLDYSNQLSTLFATSNQRAGYKSKVLCEKSHPPYSERTKSTTQVPLIVTPTDLSIRRILKTYMVTMPNILRHTLHLPPRINSHTNLSVLIVGELPESLIIPASKG